MLEKTFKFEPEIKMPLEGSQGLNQDIGDDEKVALTDKQSKSHTCELGNCVQDFD